MLLNHKVFRRTFSSAVQNPILKPDALRTKLFINNQWCDSVSGATFQTIDPATEGPITEVQRAGKEDVDLAVKAAKHAFEKGQWSKMENNDRRALMMKFADIIEQNMEELATIECVDNGKGYQFALKDIGFGVEILRYFAGWTEKIHGQQIPMNGKYFSYTQKVPRGVCGQIIPWNFPVLMALFKLAPVLATGCTTVLKPAEQTPLSALKLGEYLLQAEMPEGAINILPGFGEDAGSALVQHPDVRNIAFTGSTEVGKQIVREGSHTLKRVNLELGGKSPVIVLDDADIDLAHGQAHFAAFLNSGQFCMSGNRTFVHESIYDKFVEKAVAMAKSISIGTAFEPKMFHGPQISQEQMDKILNYIEIGKKEGAKLMCGGKRIDCKGYFVEPTVFADVTDDMTIAKEEIFGPVMCIMKFKTIDEVIERANSTQYGLVSGLMTQSLDSAMKISNSLQSGQVYVNCYAALQASTPFGGFKESGMNRELGEQSLQSYLETRCVIIKTN